MPHPQHDRVVITPRGSAASTLMAVPRICRVKMRQDVKTPSSVSGTSASSAPTGLQFTERALRVPRFAMDADELLARSLQEEEDRAAAAELLRREASANAVTSPREDFARRLDGGVRTVLAYENAEARAAALAVIPIARLKREADALVARAAERAAENERGSARADDGSVRVREISRRDALLLRLLRWFKREFFEWCDAPACLACGCADAPRPTGPGVPTPEEAKHGASRSRRTRARRRRAGRPFGSRDSTTRRNYYRRALEGAASGPTVSRCVVALWSSRRDGCWTGRTTSG